MNFVEAFRAAVGGQRIRREWWNPLCYVTATDRGTLVCWPNIHEWGGPYHVKIDDVEATDWTAEEMMAEIELETGDDR